MGKRGLLPLLRPGHVCGHSTIVPPGRIQLAKVARIRFVGGFWTVGPTGIGCLPMRTLLWTALETLWVGNSILKCMRPRTLSPRDPVRRPPACAR